MLSYQLLKNHAGILLIGDYNSLRWLHEIVHDVNERSPLIDDKEGPFLALAYDIRKAYERQRESSYRHKGSRRGAHNTESKFSGPYCCCSSGCCAFHWAISTIPSVTRLLRMH